jgi:PAS domain S-box-containing protein
MDIRMKADVDVNVGMGERCGKPFSEVDRGSVANKRKDGMSNLRQQTRTWRAFLQSTSSRLIASLGLTIAIGVTYFFAAQLSLSLLTKPDGVAVFWPAAGLASGTLIALGSGWRLPVTLGVLAASTVASLLGDRNLAAATVFALCNGGEPLLVAWLIQRHFGENFRLESLRNVVGFFIAAGIGPAVSGSIATVGFILFYSSTAPILTTWINWFASDALGIIMVAPLLIGFAGLRDNFPERWEGAVGGLTLVALAIVGAIAFGSTARHWYTAFPLAVLLPILLAAHCRPVFAAAAALILGFSVVCSTTLGIGGLGELPDLIERAYAARATLLAISTCTLVLAALFAERRQKEAALKNTNDRLELALDCAELGTWSLDLKSKRFENDVRDRHIHGYGPNAPPQTLAVMRSQVHPADLSRLDAAFAALRHVGGSNWTEYRLLPRADEDGTSQERWVSIKGAVVRRSDGTALKLLGVTRDITERKKAVQIAQRLVSIVESSDDAIVSKDLNDIITSWNNGAERLFGYSAGEVIGKSIAILIPPNQDEERAILDRIRLGLPANQLETIRCRKDGTPVDISLTVSPLYDAANAVVGASIIARDITARKRAEEHQRLLKAELDHRVKNVLATVSAIVDQTQETSDTQAGFVSALSHRIKCLASTHELLSQGQWRGVSLAEIVRREFAPYATSKTTIDGPGVTLKAEATQAVAMVLHELTTNAAKYGGLSARGGGVLLRWRWLLNGSGARLAIEWQEVGGPKVAPPSRSGYGTSIVREVIPFELRGSVDLVFAADGVRCRLEIPAEWVSDENPQRSHRQRDAPDN